SATSVHTAATAVMARALFMSSLLLLSMPSMARARTATQPPGDLHVRLVGGDGEAAVLQPGRQPCAARRLEVAELVLERRLKSGLGGQPDGGVATPVCPHLAVVGDGFRWR